MLWAKVTFSVALVCGPMRYCDIAILRYCDIGKQKRAAYPPASEGACERGAHYQRRGRGSADEPANCGAQRGLLFVCQISTEASEDSLTFRTVLLILARGCCISDVFQLARPARLRVHEDMSACTALWLAVAF